MQTYQKQMEVIGNNIANVNTAGYKASRVEFADTLQTATSGDGTAIGSGVTGTGMSTWFTQGANQQTQRNTDLAVDGDGFFEVRDTATGAAYVTRDGAFQVDSDGYLVDASSRMRVQGFTDNALTTRGDIKIDNTKDGATPFKMDATNTNAVKMKAADSFSIDAYGQIHVVLADGTSFVRGQVLLQSFTNPQALVRAGNNLYSGIASAGPLGGSSAPTSQAPGANGLGAIQSGYLEASNADLARQFADMITTQRAFEANARVITTSDELLQDIINIKR